MSTVIDQSTFNYLLLAWIALAVLTFVGLFKIIAPFGRHTSDKFGPTISTTAGWVLMEVPSLATISYFFWTGSQDFNWVSFFIYALWALHYSNRSFIYPFRQKYRKKPMPLLIVFSGIFFNVVNGFFNGYYLGNFAQFELSWFWSIPFVLGVFLFFTGMTINMRSDNTLLRLRKPGESDYKIPRGQLFKYVSCPNLMGEMIEWIGFAILSWNLASLSFAVWTIANLFPRAMAHHRWYKKNFDDYPTERKAVIPFVV